MYQRSPEGGRRLLFVKKHGGGMMRGATDRRRRRRRHCGGARFFLSRFVVHQVFLFYVSSERDGTKKIEGGGTGKVHIASLIPKTFTY